MMSARRAIGLGWNRSERSDNDTTDARGRDETVRGRAAAVPGMAVLGNQADRAVAHHAPWCSGTRRMIGWMRRQITAMAA